MSNFSLKAKVLSLKEKLPLGKKGVLVCKANYSCKGKWRSHSLPASEKNAEARAGRTEPEQDEPPEAGSRPRQTFSDEVTQTDMLFPRVASRVLPPREKTVSKPFL